MFIRPKLIPDEMEGFEEGARFKVRDPITFEFLAEDGEDKPASEYWLRRLVEGGVEETSAPEEAPAPEPEGEAP